MKNQDKMIEKLRTLVKTDTGAMTLFTYFSKRQNNSLVSGIPQLVRHAELDEVTIIELFKKMDAIGLGSFVIGRRGHKTRFEWVYGLVTVGQAALGKTDALEVLTADQVEAMTMAASVGGQSTSQTVVGRQPAGVPDGKPNAEYQAVFPINLTLIIPGRVNKAKFDKITEIIRNVTSEE